ncbi:MAG TPA: metallophosphoesterase, partial [Nitrososphaeraceae archaeon]
TFTAPSNLPVNTTLSFTLTVTDSHLKSSTAIQKVTVIHTVIPPPPPPPPPATTFSFATAGDWGSDSNARQTADNIISHHEPLVIGLGDYCYCGSDSGWWNSVVSPLHSIMFRGSSGNHEFEDSHGATDLLKAIGQPSWTYSFNYKNVHFVLLDEDGSTPSASTLDKDLATARADPAIKWIVVAFHEPIYTSPSDHAPDENGIKSTVLPLIDKYHVDLVLQAHNHNYQRSVPLKADHQDPSGSVYMVVGTGGQDFYKLNGQASYMTKQFTGIHGFLNVDVSDTTLNGSFIANDGTIKDTFTINK